MVTAKCIRCGGTAIGSTFTEASAKINHAVGLSRGIKCGDNWNKVQEIKDDTTTTPTTVTEPAAPKQTVDDKSKGDDDYSKVEGKTGEKIVLDESQSSTKQKSKSKK